VIWAICIGIFVGAALTFSAGLVVHFSKMDELTEWWKWNSYQTELREYKKGYSYGWHDALTEDCSYDDYPRP
jgi:hypothetical protein